MMSEQTKPWEDGQFDAEKAWTLIQNLRGDLDKAKTDKQALSTEKDQLAMALADANKGIEDAQRQAQEASTLADTRSNELAEVNAVRSKEHLLLNAGLPVTLAGVISGADEDGWKAAVDQIAAVRAPVERAPNPAQSGSAAPPSEDEAGRKFFGL